MRPWRLWKARLRTYNRGLLTCGTSLAAIWSVPWGELFPAVVLSILRFDSCPNFGAYSLHRNNDPESTRRNPVKMKWAVIVFALTFGMFAVAQDTKSAGAETKDAAKTAGKDTKTAAKKTGQATKTAAKDVGKDTKVAAKDTEKGTKTVAKNTEKGAKTATKDTEKGAKTAGKDTEKAANRTGSATKKGVKSVGHDLKKGTEKTGDALK